MKHSKLETLLSSVPEVVAEAIAQFTPKVKNGNILQVNAPTRADLPAMADATVWVLPLLSDHGFIKIELNIGGNYHGFFDAELGQAIYDMHFRSLNNRLTKNLD